MQILPVTASGRMTINPEYLPFGVCWPGIFGSTAVGARYMMIAIVLKSFSVVGIIPTL
jgi:hypothetical protein